ncbi:MAG: cyclic nucleotide-binding domain-containing protein [Halofilum sp. (in: g-proteobacteria)]|nr:cyclic nucleotide-binding domain-containing protein [Halofilum sp. (in: g-proteobacteria)]
MDESTIAELGDHTFVGDMSLVTGDCATATVELTEPTRYVAFPVEPLNRLLQQDAEIRRQPGGGPGPATSSASCC